MNGINGIIVDGAVYEANPEDSLGTCTGCDLKPADNIGCPYAETCIDWGSVFRFSQSLTDKLNDNE